MEDINPVIKSIVSEKLNPVYERMNNIEILLAGNVERTASNKERIDVNILSLRETILKAEEDLRKEIEEIKQERKEEKNRLAMWIKAIIIPISILIIERIINYIVL